MANADQPRGLWPVRHLLGGEIRTSKYTLTTGATVFIGDVLKAVAGGTVEAAAADDGVIVVGVSAEYIAAGAAGTKVKVWDDPYIVFGIQADTGTAVNAADIFRASDHVAGSGSAVTKLSGHELDSSEAAAGSGVQLFIIGKIKQPDNAWGEHVDLEVIFNEHIYRKVQAVV